MTAKAVNVAKMVEPRYLTLTGSPANQTAFKIIRNDGEKMNKPHMQRRRVRRSDSLVSVTFEAGLDEDGVKKVLAEWGIEDFTLERADDSYRAVLRSDVTNTMDVAIPDGRVLTVVKPTAQRADKSALSVLRMDFSKEAFPDTADVTAWLDSNGIDTTTVTIKPGDTATVVQRSDVQADETRSMVIETGVSFTVARADTQDIPDNFVAVVNDTAFGSWGWGQLDFSATMADKEYCSAADDAVYTLRTVLDRIMFYSETPIAVRKDLVRSAVNQFADHVTSLMDALPSKVVVAIRSSFSKESPVSTATTATTATPTTAPTTEGATLTRSDVLAIFGEASKGLSDQIAALTETLAQRSEAPAPVAAAAAAPAAPGATDTPTLADVVRSTAQLSENLTTLARSVAALEGGTVVRSDAGDNKPAAKTAQATRSDDVFRGMFGSRASA